MCKEGINWSGRHAGSRSFGEIVASGRDRAQLSGKKFSRGKRKLLKGKTLGDSVYLRVYSKNQLPEETHFYNAFPIHIYAVVQWSLFRMRSYNVLNNQGKIEWFLLVHSIQCILLKRTLGVTIPIINLKIFIIKLPIFEHSY